MDRIYCIDCRLQSDDFRCHLNPPIPVYDHQFQNVIYFYPLVNKRNDWCINGQLKENLCNENN